MTKFEYVFMYFFLLCIGMSQQSPRARILESSAISFKHVPVIGKDMSGNLKTPYINHTYNSQQRLSDDYQELYDYPTLSSLGIKTATAHAYAYSENIMCLENVITPNGQSHAMQVGPDTGSTFHYENQPWFEAYLENDGQSFSMTKCVVYNSKNGV